MPRQRRAFIAVAVLIAALSAGAAYVSTHPASVGSLIVQSAGIYWFEPTYVDRKPGVELLDDLRSYRSVEEARAWLRTRGIDWEEAPGSPGSAERTVRPFVMHGLEIVDFEHLGTRGHLSLGFFNDRLVSAIFYPANVDGYLATLEERTGISVREGKDAHPARHTRIWVFTDYHGRRYVGRADRRLEDEESSWIMKYS